MIRLRLNLSGRDLGYRFGGISDSTVSRTFLHVVDVLYQRLKPLIIWPDRDVVVGGLVTNTLQRTVAYLTTLLLEMSS